MNINWRYMILVACFQLAATPAASATSYRGLTKLDPKSCSKAEDAVVNQLPLSWRKYSGFIKVCNLRKEKKGSDISLISIWEQDYFKSMLQSGQAPHDESFPLPIIVDRQLAQLGSLPEVYPEDDVTSLVIHYGKWKSLIPTVILVDVENPAEGGDYYYAPIIYNDTSGRYEMKRKEVINGRRR